MHLLTFALVVASGFALLGLTDGAWFRKPFRKPFRTPFRTPFRKVNGAAKVDCKVLFGMDCPPNVTADGVAMPDSTVGGEVATGNKACKIWKSKCKGVIADMEFVYPFSAVFSDYDINGDKEITYVEFVRGVMKAVPLEDPSELMEPFLWADVDGNEKIDTDEFIGAPFLFAHFIKINVPSHEKRCLWIKKSKELKTNIYRNKDIISRL